MAESGELQALSARVDALEREVAALRTRTPLETHAKAPAPARLRLTASPQPAPVIAEAEVTAAWAPERDVESIVGGRGLLYVGAFLIVLGAAFFLNIAFDRGWIGPSMRVAIGLIAGVALVAGANAVRRRIHPYFADALIGIGAGVLYLSLYAAGVLFHLVTVSVESLCMIVVTATVSILAYRDNRQPLALFGVVAGLIVPLLLGANPPNLLTLYGYLAIVSAGAIVLGELRNWRAVPVVALVGTAIYWLLFSLAISPESQRTVSLSMALILYALFASTMLLAWRRKSNVDGWYVTVAGINAVWFFLGILGLGVGAFTLAVVFLAIAALHLIAGLRLKQRPQFWLATIALSFAIPPIGQTFSGVASATAIATAVHVAWAAEAVVIGTLGARWRERGLSVLALALIVTIVLFTIGLYANDNDRFLLNERFISMAAAAIAFAMIRMEWRKAGILPARNAWIASVANGVLGLFAISPEAMTFGKLVAPHSGNASMQVSLSIAWAVYGAILVVAGIRRKDPPLRWFGLSLLGITVLKVFSVDLTDFDIIFRVISALGIGVLLLVLAYLYQSHLRAPKSDP